MFKRLIVVFLLLCIGFQSSFATIYKNDSKIQSYKSYIEEKAGDFISEKSLSEKMDLLVKIQTLLGSYEKKGVSEWKENFMYLLYALEEYVEEKISWVVTNDVTQLVITIIDDVRCDDCYVDSMVYQLEWMDFLSHAEYVYKDFSDSWVQEYLIENDISYLPAIVFSTDDIDDNSQITPYLEELENGSFSLQVGATFDPFIERSERWFLIIDEKVLSDIKEDSFILWKLNAEITWLEYSDMECPFCARLHNDGTIDSVREEFWDDINIIFQHFPLSFHTNAKDISLALECIWNKYGNDSFYDMVNTTFDTMWNNNFSFTEFYSIANEKNYNANEVEKCVENEIYIEKVESQIDRGIENFSITGTPWNVLINNNTWEYMILWWAYPFESFKEAIESLQE